MWCWSFESSKMPLDLQPHILYSIMLAFSPLERAATGRKWRHQHLKRQSQPHLHAARPAHTDEALATV
ncbi:hypothetical protein B5X24_HaOG214488 [Helicoverpa armigera]|uniref:Uncharacterized protein n=1 Tax=Helicoverpa armigera TaxID=29058 RepID=A0A2W1BCE6_HELAM|nr:hypothetical protein B5X24_HaOG214488 [Helicoverpa armigera]